MFWPPELVGGFNPSQTKILVKLDHFPQIGVEKNKYLKPTPSEILEGDPIGTESSKIFSTRQVDPSWPLVEKGSPLNPLIHHMI